MTLDSRLSRRGVTLVELLITIMIIAVLAGLILGVAAVAGQTAREAHSRHMVLRLHTLLTQHLDTFKVRRVRLRPTIGSVEGVEQLINAAFPNSPAKRGAALAEARLYGLREMMLMEVPDRWSDVLLRPVPATPNTTGWAVPLYLSERPSMSNVYLRRYQGLVGRTNVLSGVANTGEEIERNQGAECLYMVITLACGDGEARTLFHESNIGDSDGDGAPEFLDGWGRPINFLRWAPGFDSDVQLNVHKLSSMSTSESSLLISQDHDPFDIFRAEPNAFRLVPLIYSPGRDENSGLAVSQGTYVPWRKPPNNVSVGSAAPYLSPRLTPYELAPVNAGLTVYFGTKDADGTATDNIHNHLLGER